MPKVTSSFAPLHVRGKRKSASSIRKRRQSSDQELGRSSVSGRTDIITATSKKRPKRLFGLENLPTEILEIIFLYSGNPNLPLVSSTLLAQLSGSWLQKELMTAVLAPVLLDLRIQPSADQLAAVETLLACRFCTLEVFCDCLRDCASHCKYPVGNNPAWLQRRNRVRLTNQSELLSLIKCQWWPEVTGRALGNGRMAHPFRLPSKLLHGPWTAERTVFLECCIPFLQGSVERRSSSLRIRASAFDGITDAIRENSRLAIQLLVLAGAEPESGALRYAVTEAGCNHAVISELMSYYHGSLRYRYSDEQHPLPLDALDPELWAWADQPEQVANGNGKLVKSLLRRYLAKEPKPLLAMHGRGPG